MNKKVLIGIVCVLLIIIAVIVCTILSNKENNSTNVIKGYNPLNIDAKEDDQIEYKVAEVSKYNQQLTLLVPSTWKFEIVENEDETSSGMVVDSYYGIKFYPDSDNKDKNAVIYSKKEKLGVCGTGLKTEKIVTESGIEAEVGYFNMGKDWNYVAYRKDNVNIVAYNNGIEDDVAKEALEILKTMTFTDTTNITMKIKEGTLTKTSATVILESVDKSKTFGTGAWFQIEKKENGVWTELPVMALISWNEIEFIPNEYGIIEVGANWEELYGELGKGEYRIVKSIAHNVYVYAEFSI